MTGAPPRVGVGMSPEPSSEISGKAEAARSKSISSFVENELLKKSVMVPSSASSMALAFGNGVPAPDCSTWLEPHSEVDSHAHPATLIGSVAWD